MKLKTYKKSTLLQNLLPKKSTRQTLVCHRWFSSAAVGFSKGRIDAGSDFFVGAPQFSRMSNVCLSNLRRHSRMGRMKCLSPPLVLENGSPRVRRKAQFSRMAHANYEESRFRSIRRWEKHSFCRPDVRKNTIFVHPAFGKVLFLPSRRSEKTRFSSIRRSTFSVFP